MKFLRVLFLMVVLAATVAAPAFAAGPTYDISTLAGKVASVNGTAGLQTHFSAFIEQEASNDPYLPLRVDGALLSGDTSGLAAGNVAANQDTAGAPQNETAIAVDPNNPNRVVAAANDYVTRTWSCTANGAPCSAQGDAYSGTYYSNNGGQTWQALATDPQHIGTLIPGVEHLVGGPYDAGGDPALAFDSRGNIYYAGLGFDRTAAPNTVAVNKGTFDSGGALHWGAPVFINPTTAPSTLNDKEWIAADHHVSSPFRDRVYVSWTRYIFNAHTGAYVQSPIFLSFSADGGQTFSAPQGISGNVLYSQGSRPVVGPDGTVYVFWDGSTRLAALDSTYMVKSSDGGASWSKPVAVSPLADIDPLANTAFRVNSFPAADVAPDGTLYVAWSTQVRDSAAQNSYGDPASLCASFLGCSAPHHSAAVYSKSSDGGQTWSNPVPIFPGLDAQNRVPAGYNLLPAGTTLTPNSHRMDSLWPGVAINGGKVYLSAYVADTVSPWQTCASAPPPPPGRIICNAPGPYINNAKLNYYVTDLATGQAEVRVSGKAINTRYGFGGGFIGDYTGLAAGADGRFHAFWTDTNVAQNVYWFYGTNFNGTLISQEDVVTASGGF